MWPTNKTSRQEDERCNSEEVDEEEESQGSKVTMRKKKQSETYCGSPTISPVKEGEGLLRKPSVGRVSEVEGMENRQIRVQQNKRDSVS